ncbi:MAG: replicative DNA helicase [Magnetococcales bacterium]|nr:replicative DNA helicase [Magnetococcales bacterium]
MSDTESTQRLPLYSLEAEQSVLGSLLLDNTVSDYVADIITADDYYIGAHRVIYQAISVLLERGEPADPVILKQYLEKNDALSSVGGTAYLARLVDTVPATANVRAWARLIHDKAVMRDLAQQASAIVDRVYQSDDSLDRILDDAEQQIFQVGESREHRRSNYHDMKSILVPVFDRIEQLMEQRISITGVPTGFIDLDDKLAGLQAGDLIVVAGRPSMGKTALALNFAANSALKHRVPVGIFSLEMSKEQLAMRLLSSVASIDAQALRTGKLSDQQYGDLTRSADQLSGAPLYIDDTSGLSITSLRAKARRMKREKQIQMIIVDYMQQMRGSQNNVENRTQEISEISRELKAIAKELRLPVVAVSQLSRSPEGRTDKRPVMSDLRESGSIEQDADVVLLVFREEYYKRNDPTVAGKAEVIIAKQRNGPTGTIILTFLNQFTRFDNHAKEY